MSPKQITDEVRGILLKNLGSSFKLYLFGSRATGNNSENSDFDFLVDCGEKIEDSKWSKILGAIEDIKTLYSIDLTDKSAADPQFFKTIEKDLVDVTEPQG